MPQSAPQRRRSRAAAPAPPAPPPASPRCARWCRPATRSRRPRGGPTLRCARCRSWPSRAPRRWRRSRRPAPLHVRPPAAPAVLRRAAVRGARGRAAAPRRRVCFTRYSTPGLTRRAFARLRLRAQVLHCGHRPQRAHRARGDTRKAGDCGGGLAESYRRAVLLPTHRGGCGAVHLQPHGGLHRRAVVPPRRAGGRGVPGAGARPGGTGGARSAQPYSRRVRCARNAPPGRRSRAAKRRD